MKRQTIEEYLDGSLDAASRAEVEKSLAQDSAAARMLARVKSERALRKAVYASYQPSANEALDFAGQVLEACHDDAAAPVGSIGAWTWSRRISGIAAAVAIMAGLFFAGRMTAPPTTVQVAGADVVRTITKVVKVGPGDEIAVKDFTQDETEKMNNFMKSGQDSPSGMASMDLSETGLFPGHM